MTAVAFAAILLLLLGTFLDVSVAVILAFGTADPLGSTTVPMIVP